LQIKIVLNRKHGLSYIAWSIPWIALQAVALRYTFEFDWLLCITDAAITNLLIVITGYVMITIMRFYQPTQLTRLMMTVGAAAICMVCMRQITLYFIDFDTDYFIFLEKSIFLRTLYFWLMIALISVISWLWFAIKEQQEIEARNSATEKLAKEAELSRLRQQLQPHFLFNSLNSISALAGSRPEEARKMIQQLSDFLRGTLKKDDQQLVMLSEELDHLRLYLEIEKVRFGHRLETEIHIDEKSPEMKIPSLLLQPVVENAIKFGLYDTTGKTVIQIRATAEENYLSIVVENPFDPETAQPKQGTGFGLNSVQRRLSLLYARQDLLSTKQTGTIFTTHIKIPQAV
jgi:two-component system LytT family sensor kinase